MFTRLAFAALALPFVAANASPSCPSDAGFVFPNSSNPADQNLVFPQGSHVTVKWKSSWPSVNMGFIPANGTQLVYLAQNSTSGEYNWPVDVDGMDSVDRYCYMYMQNAQDPSQYCYSSLWSTPDPAEEGNENNVLSVYTASTTPSVTQIPTPLQALSQSTSAGPQGTEIILVSEVPVAQDSSSSSAGLSTGAKIGIGIGVPLGVAAFAALGAYIWYIRKRLRHHENAAATIGGGTPLDKSPPVPVLNMPVPPSSRSPSSAIDIEKQSPLQSHPALVSEAPTTHGEMAQEIDSKVVGGEEGPQEVLGDTPRSQAFDRGSMAAAGDTPISAMSDGRLELPSHTQQLSAVSEAPDHEVYELPSGR